MVYRWMTALRSERGQGTVEYVGLILLLAGVIGAVAAFGSTFSDDGIGQAVVDKLQETIEGVTAGDGKK